jgi:hypothetical protein
MHADRPGDRPRLLYWYRTAPGIVLGRPPLDEDAIRTIEEQHPDIDFDWPAILALAEVMTPEDEAAPPSARKPKKGREMREPRDPREPRRGRDGGRHAASPDTTAHPTSVEPAGPQAGRTSGTVGEPLEPLEPLEPVELEVEESVSPRNRLVEELAGREIGARLRARHADIIARIEDADIDGGVKDALFKQAEAIDPETWMTPEQVLEGVRSADASYEKLRAALRA